ncbi:MAG: endolytic transglycosylase MltG, partial [Acidobacteriota bacterium]|nr:endolytic transglycosylase MltG [Acidobacteriota bacterium]
PSTYEFTRTQSMQEMASAMVKQFRQVAREIGLNGDLQKTVTMASIVERETAKPEERAMVASVYYYRLDNRIALQADPSVMYAELLQGSYWGALHHDDMKFRSDYNTYAHPGLPPGPIGNPGKTSLEAAMHPAVTDYFYFVADGSGHHRFAHDLEEHNRNVAEYRRAMKTESR